MLRAWKWVEFSGGGGAQKEKWSDTTQQAPGSSHISYLIPKSYLADNQPLGKIRNRETFSTRGLRLVGSRDSGWLWEFLPIPGAQCDVTMCFSLSLFFFSPSGVYKIWEVLHV